MYFSGGRGGIHGGEQNVETSGGKEGGLFIYAYNCSLFRHDPSHHPFLKVIASLQENLLGSKRMSFKEETIKEDGEEINDRLNASSMFRRKKKNGT